MKVQVPVYSTTESPSTVLAPVPEMSEIAPDAGTADDVRQVNLAYHGAGVQVDLEAELVVENQDGSGAENGSREDLAAGVHERSVREVEDRCRVVQDTSLQVSCEIDGVGAPLDHS